MALQDDVRIELQDLNSTIFEPDEISRAITDALMKFSEKSPREVIETLATAANSRLVDISKVTGLIYGYDALSFHSIYGVEYPTGEYPRKYRNFKVIGTNIEMVLNTAPNEAGKNVYATCYKAHTETTLPEAYKSLVARVAAALAAKYKPLKFINEFQAETTKFSNITTAIGNMSARITKAIDDLSSGRAMVGDEREAAIDAIDDMAALVAQMLADIKTAEGYYNKANIGQPEREYLNSASMEGNAAVISLNKARGYLAVETTSSSYRAHAAGELTSANTYLNQAKGYLEHLKARITVINLADKYEAWGRRMEADVEKELNTIAIRRGYKEWSRA